MSRYIIGRRGWTDHSSKYGLEPYNFDEDVQANEARYATRKAEIKRQLVEIIEHDPTRMDESYELIIECLKEMRERYVF